MRRRGEDSAANERKLLHAQARLGVTLHARTKERAHSARPSPQGPRRRRRARRRPRRGSHRLHLQGVQRDGRRARPHRGGNAVDRPGGVHPFAPEPAAAPDRLRPSALPRGSTISQPAGPGGRRQRPPLRQGPVRPQPGTGPPRNSPLLPARGRDRLGLDPNARRRSGRSRRDGSLLVAAAGAGALGARHHGRRADGDPLPFSPPLREMARCAVLRPGRGARGRPGTGGAFEVLGAPLLSGRCSGDPRRALAAPP